jgi:hypothetical protein
MGGGQAVLWIKEGKEFLLGRFGPATMLVVPQVKQVPSPECALHKDNQCAQDKEKCEAGRSPKKIHASNREQNDYQVTQPREGTN